MLTEEHKISSQALAVAPIAGDQPLVHMIERVARDVAFPLDRLEKLMEMHERVTMRNAETAWNEAMAAAQADITMVGRDSNNPQTRSRYASYAAMDAMVRPIYSKHGFGLSFGTAEGASENNIRVVCDVMKGAFVKRFHIDIPADGKGAKGGEVMTRTHAMGSAATYGRRYLLTMIFNIAVGEIDDDGNAASRPISARARNASIAQIKDPNERQAAQQAAADEWVEKAGQGLINAAGAKELVREPTNEVVWDDEERPATAEDFEDTTTVLKAAYIESARDYIRKATDAKTLHTWWSSDESKKARHDFELNATELADLKSFCLARITALKPALKVVNGDA